MERKREGGFMVWQDEETFRRMWKQGLDFEGKVEGMG